MSEDLPFGSRGGTGVRHYFPLDGEYLIKVSLKRTSTSTSSTSTSRTTRHSSRRRTRRSVFTYRRRGEGQPAPLSLRDVHGGRGRRLSDAGVGRLHDVGATPDWMFDSRARRAPHVSRVLPRQVLGARRRSAAAAQASARRDRHRAHRRQPRPEGPALGEHHDRRPYNPTGASDTPSRRRIFVCRPAGAAGRRRRARGRFSRRWRAAPIAGR